MPGRDPQAAERSARIGELIHAEMKHQGLTGVELRARLQAAGVNAPNAQWITNRLHGKVSLIKPEHVVYGPTPDLEKIAEVLQVPVSQFVAVVNSGPAKPGDAPAESVRELEAIAATLHATTSRLVRAINVKFNAAKQQPTPPHNSRR